MVGDGEELGAVHPGKAPRTEKALCAALGHNFSTAGVAGQITGPFARAGVIAQARIPTTPLPASARPLQDKIRSNVPELCVGSLAEIDDGDVCDSLRF